MRSLGVFFSISIFAWLVYLTMATIEAMSLTEEETELSRDPNTYDNADDSLSHISARRLIECRGDERPEASNESEPQDLAGGGAKPDSTVVNGLKIWMQNERMKQQTAGAQAKEAIDTRNKVAKTQSQGRENAAGVQRAREALETYRKAERDTADSASMVMRLGSSSKTTWDHMKISAQPKLPYPWPLGHPDTNPLPEGLRHVMRYESARHQTAQKQAHKAYGLGKEARKSMDDLVLSSGFRLTEKEAAEWIRAANKVNKLGKKTRSALKVAKEAGKNTLNLALSSKELGDHMDPSLRPSEVRVPKRLERGQLVRVIRFKSTRISEETLKKMETPPRYQPVRRADSPGPEVVPSKRPQTRRSDRQGNFPKEMYKAPKVAMHKVGMHKRTGSSSVQRSDATISKMPHSSLSVPPVLEGYKSPSLKEWYETPRSGRKSGIGSPTSSKGGHGPQSLRASSKYSDQESPKSQQARPLVHEVESQKVSTELRRRPQRIESAQQQQQSPKKGLSRLLCVGGACLRPKATHD